MKVKLNTIQMWLPIQLMLVIGGADLLLLGSSPRQHLNFVELAQHDGYKTESHFVTTSDGYTLGVFRVPLQKNCTPDPSKAPIIFMHALYLSSDDCLLPGPGKAHCYLYADRCYDVWVPNFRGNFYSRNHTIYDPDKDSKFWDFQLDEMAMYDLPAIIDYVLNQTGKSQVTYVGYAQGVGVMMLLCAKKPEYNSKINVGFGLSTAAWLNNSRFIVTLFDGAISPLLTAANNVGINVEVFRRGGVENNIIDFLCGSTELTYPICSLFIFAVLGYNKFQITDDVLIDVSGHVPCGTSLKNFNRWGQMIRGFNEFDYGPVTNLAKYGQIAPPAIDLSQVTVKWVFIASVNDYVSDLRDLETLTSNLPNSDVSTCVLKDKTFAHLDFVYGKDIPNYIVPTIFNMLESGELVCN